MIAKTFKFLKHGGLFFILLLLLFPGCNKESFEPESKSELRYFPLGDNIYPAGIANADAGLLLAAYNDNRIMLCDGLTENFQWSSQIDGQVVGFTANKDGSVWVVKHSPFFWEEMTLCCLDSLGKLVFNTTGSKMIPSKPNNQEFYMSIASDGQNGVYFLIALLDFGVSPEKLLPSDIYLVHANNQNTIDMRLPLNEYFFRIQGDRDGNLYGLSHNTADFNPTGTGATDTFHLIKFDLAALNNKQVKRVWEYNLTVVEYYVNYFWEHNFQVNTNSKNIFVSHTTAQFLDLETGIKIHSINKADGAPISVVADPSPTFANSYSEGSLLTGFADENGVYAAYKIGATTRIISMDNSGNKNANINLKGDNNRCSPIGFALIKNKPTVFGYSTKGKSTQYAPFSFQFETLK